MGMQGLCDPLSQAETVCCASSPAEYQTSIQEKLPLIIGSSAGLVFLIAVVVIAIVCNRWVMSPCLEPRPGFERAAHPFCHL